MVEDIKLIIPSFDSKSQMSLEVECYIPRALLLVGGYVLRPLSEVAEGVPETKKDFLKWLKTVKLDSDFCLLLTLPNGDQECLRRKSKWEIHGKFTSA